MTGQQVARATKFCTAAPNICGGASFHPSGTWNFEVARKYWEILEKSIYYNQHYAHDWSG